MYIFLYGLVFAEPLEHPKINSQYFRPALDSQHFLSVNETRLGTCGSFLGKGTASQTDNPFLFVSDDGNETEMLRSLGVLDLAGGLVFCRSRLGIHVPLILRAMGSLPSGAEFVESGIGDILIDYKYRISKPEDDIGVAVSLRGSAPTATGQASIGNDESLIEVELNLDTTYRNTIFALNVGHKGQSTWSDEQSYFGSAIYARGGVAMPLPYNSGVATEIYSSFMYGADTVEQAFLGEVMLTGWKKIGIIALQAGMGYGFGSAIGSPDLRGLFGFAWLPEFQKKDTDHDGIINSIDKCPNESEDIDGFQDTDGCPDPTQVTIQFTENGVILDNVQWNIGERKGTGKQTLSLPSQGLILEASLAGFIPIQREIIIQGGEKHTVTIPLKRLQGSLQIIPTGPNGANIQNATWSFVDSNVSYPIHQIASLPPGEANIRIMADGYKVANHQITVKANELTAFSVVMNPTKAQIKEGKIDFDGIILFRTNSAIIDESSFSILHDIGDVLKDYPNIKEIRIEGHTDNIGSNTKNKRLSQERADSVRTFLIEYGIEPQRMNAQGFGEEQPVASNSTKEGKQKNRRVEFKILDMVP